jgi:hypothetical protein
MLGGIAIAARQNRRLALVLVSTVFYYLLFGSCMHSEIRYSLPMQAILFCFAGVAVSWFLFKKDRAERAEALHCGI